MVRAAKSSRLVSALAILGLVLTSSLMVLILDSGSLANPTLPFENGNANANPGPTGTLVVQLLTNQNESDKLSNPANTLFHLGEKAMTVTPEDNSSNPQVLITDVSGGVLEQLLPGHYVVRLVDETLSIKIPVQVFVGKETKLKVNIYGSAYPLAYSEESAVLPVVGKAQSNMFVQVRSSAPVANLSERVLLKVRGGAPGVGYLANATVLAQQPPAQGTQWLELGTGSTIDPLNATSIVLTTWTYSSFITVSPIGLTGVSADD